MGIPRLSQDLKPYAELAALGRTLPTSTIDLAISKLVIDGPSLIYHVYNKLLTYKACQSPIITAGVPSYAEINGAVRFLLADFERRSVEIVAIYFDGALPLQKRGVRAERLEKARCQLKAFREWFPSLPAPASPIDPLEFGKALWGETVPPSTAPALPPPPLMVASTIESLLDSSWRDRVKVVPTEADHACAGAALKSAAAILSNDSDFALYDLGPQGCLTLLETLEKKNRVKGEAMSSLLVKVIRPAAIAQRLKLPSLLRFGFERFLDQSATAAIVKEQSLNEARLEKYEAEYQDFSSQYGLEFEPPKVLELQGFDPRTAEFIVQVESLDGAPFVYLPIVIEDPTRDWSWAYGQHVRHIAYSLAYLFKSPSKPDIIVVEHARKGPHMGKTMLPVLGPEDLQDRLKGLLEKLNKFFNINEASTQSDNEICLRWWTLALHGIMRDKRQNHKSIHQQELVRFLGLDRGIAKLSWDEIHLHANVQAALYSFRVLKQILAMVLRGDVLETRLPLLPIFEILKVLPPIEMLFMDIQTVRRLVCEIPAEATESILNPITKDFYAHLPKFQILGARAAQDHVETPKASSKDYWEQPRQKRRREQKGSEREKAKEPNAKNSRNKNMFDILSKTS